MTDILEKSLENLALDLRSGMVNVQDLAHAVVDNHNCSNGSLNAYKIWDKAKILQQAEVANAAFAAGFDAGLFQGIPISVKDLFGVDGFPTFAGSPKPLPKLWEQEGPVIKALKSQLAMLTGKTHTMEFAFGGLGVNPHWGTPRNPWDLAEHRIPGGSSSGAGVSLAVGSSLMALGTDTAGSVRIPASMTGSVGLKTSIGRWSVGGIVPLSPSLDSIGLLARSVEDISFGFFALDPTSKSNFQRLLDLRTIDITGLRLGMCDRLFWDDCSPGIDDCVKDAVNELTKKGARLQALDLPEVEQIYPVFKKGGLAAPELFYFLKSALPEWISMLDEKIAQRLEDAATLSAYEYIDRLKLIERLSLQINERFKTVDVVVSPTVVITPSTIEDIEELSEYRRTNLLSLRNTSIVNYLGLCALTMPVGLDSAGMPVGLQLIARNGEDERLIAIAGTIEKCLGSGRYRIGKPPTWG